jgi:hypothetical protein
VADLVDYAQQPGKETDIGPVLPVVNAKLALPIADAWQVLPFANAPLLPFANAVQALPFVNETVASSGNVGNLRCRFAYIDHPYPAAAFGLSAESDLWTGRSLIDWAFLPGSEVDQTEFISNGPTYSILVQLDPKPRPNFVRWSDAAKRELSLIRSYSSPKYLVAFNLIQATWQAPAPTLASVVSDIRNKVDLPIQDVARMVGVGRRQFYNLMAGASRSSEGEARIRAVQSYVDRLYALVGSDPKQVRTALLAPLTKFGSTNLFESMSRWNGPSVEEMFAQVTLLLSRPESDLHRKTSDRLRLSEEQMSRAANALKERRRVADSSSE